MQRERKPIRLYALLAFLLLGATSWASDDEALQRYIEIFTTGTEEDQRQALERLAWAGESDPALFDLIESKALAGYPGLKGRDSKRSEIKRVGRYVQALAFSGREEYRPTLEEIEKRAVSSTLRSQAREAQQQIAFYAKRNALINDESEYDDRVSPAYNRLGRMLRSDDWDLKRIAAQRVVHEQLHNVWILEILSSQLETNAFRDSDDELFVDTIAWMTRALASSAHPDWKPLVEKIARKAPAKKVRRHAKRALRAYR
jgi:hypothetical protein